MKTAKKLLALVLVLVMVFGLVQMASAEFKDADDIENQEAADVLAYINVIEGRDDGNFDPTATVTRAEAAAIIARMLLKRSVADGLPNGATGFTDVPSDIWYAKYVAYCVSAGIIVGRSATIFDPNAPVTAAEFAIMLMRALGIGDPSRWVGPNWAMFAIIDGMALGILTGDGDFTGPCSRDSAALFAFNALIAGDEDVITTETEWWIIVMPGALPGSANASALAALKDKAKVTYDTERLAIQAGVGAGGTYLDDFIVVADVKETKVTKGSIANDVYNLYTSTVSDAFYRPNTTVWMQKDNKDIIAVASSPVPLLSYTDYVSAKTIFGDLGLKAPYNTTAPTYVDGAPNASPTSLVSNGGTLPDSGPGVLTEVYKVGSGYRIVIINTYVGTIAKVNDVSATADANVLVDEIDPSVAPGTLADSGLFETTGFSKDDVVLYTAAYDDDSGEYIVQSVDLADTLTVVPTARTAYTFRVGSTTYAYSANCFGAVSSADVTGKNERVIYLDTYDNVIYIEDADHTANYALVLLAEAVAADPWAGTPAGNKARLLLADGTTQDVPFNLTASNAASAGAVTPPTTVANYVGRLVEYAAGTTGYVLAVVDDTAGSSVNIVRNRVSMTDGGSPWLNANNKTIFFVYNTTSEKYSVYTGISAIPNITGATVAKAYQDNGMAVAVYVSVLGSGISTGTQAAKNIIWVNLASYDGDQADVDKGAFVEYEAVVDGEIVTIQVAPIIPVNDPALPAVVFESDWIYGCVEKNDDGFIVSATTFADTQTSSGAIAVTGDIITFGSIGVLFNSSTLFFSVDANGVLGATTASALNGKTFNVTFYTTNEILTAAFCY